MRSHEDDRKEMSESKLKSDAHFMGWEFLKSSRSTTTFYIVF